MRRMVYRQLPNSLTVCRLVLAGVFFVVLNQYRYGLAGNPQHVVLWAAVGVFVAAAVTDWLDGYLARKWKVESKFGRIMDPFCDKVLVIGAFVYLAGPRFAIAPAAGEGAVVTTVTGVYPWMAAVILARELLVTSIRGEMESEGVKFGANLFGKLKMILQSITVPTVLFIVILDPLKRELTVWFREGFVYATVVVTILSGVPYVTAAWRAMKGKAG